MMKQKIKVFVDDRENGVINEELIDLGVEPEVVRLNVGDYVCIDGSEGLSVCFERKTIDDFCGSILDGRIEHQVEGMKMGFMHNYILISGRIEDRTSKISENCILGKITSLIVKHGMHVILVDNDRQLAFVIKSVIEKYKKLHDIEMKGGDDDGKKES